MNMTPVERESIKKALAERAKLKGDCVEWQGGASSGGYGQIKLNGKRWAVHRASYEIYVAPIPDGLHIIHLCDNRRCISPNHLAAATHDANMADMKIKGRAPHGSKHPKSKLKPKDIPRIKELAERGRRHADIAKKYGVSRPTITKAVNGSTYAKEETLATGNE